MYGQDSDFVQWILSYEPYTHPQYDVEVIQENGYGGDIHHGEYIGDYEGGCHSDVGNDEIIARTLQDDFSQLEVEESSINSHDHGGCLHTPAIAYDWHDLPVENYSSEWAGNEHDQSESVDSVHISSCSSPSDSEEYLYAWEGTDEYELDGEVGKRLNQMISIPHVPRINGEIPSEDEAVSDHERLFNRLELYGFVEHKVQGDGNCQFRALSDQLYNTQERHKVVRQHVAKQLKAHPDIYEGYVPMEYSEYLKRMSRSGEWGDHVTLQAAADTYRVKILVITSFKDTCYIEILPKSQTYKGAIFLSFWAEVHYNSIYFQGDMPSNELRRKKKWWRFGN